MEYEMCVIALFYDIILSYDNVSSSYVSLNIHHLDWEAFSILYDLTKLHLLNYLNCKWGIGNRKEQRHSSVIRHYWILLTEQGVSVTQYQTSSTDRFKYYRHNHHIIHTQTKVESLTLIHKNIKSTMLQSMSNYSP